MRNNGLLTYPRQAAAARSAWQREAQCPSKILRNPEGFPFVTSVRAVVAVSENSSPVHPDPPSGRDVGRRLTGTAVGRIYDQARQTSTAARAGRVTNSEGEPGMLDLTPMRELLADLMDELGQLRLRDRIARALRQAADIIEQPPGR